MSDSGDDPNPEDARGEKRREPYEYLPHVVINPSRDPEERTTGFVRDESRNGFSAQFNGEFPYEHGDILDVRVGYQRAWAQVVWVKTLMDNLYMVGFRLHPSEFLDSVTRDN